MGSPNDKCLQSLMKYLQDESLDTKMSKFYKSGRQTENAQKIPQQMNENDCGVFICTFSEYTCHGADISFSQEDIRYFWHKMIYEIYTCKLLICDLNMWKGQNPSVVSQRHVLSDVECGFSHDCVSKTIVYILALYLGSLRDKLHPKY